MKLLAIAVFCLVFVISTNAGYAPRLRRQTADGFWWEAPPSRRPTTTTTTTTPRGPSVTDENALRRCLNSCLTTSQYNPICGTNRVTYTNEGRLVCAQNCGVDVQVLFRGSCEPFG